ncbi:MAG: hypothetical protein JNM95_10035 [Chitinophagaceae bacterium]|nr:hypothetical protein [Chitinophagaceae bacterium]
MLNKRQIRVFVASADDVKLEREKLTKYVKRTSSRLPFIELKLVMWEDLSKGNQPQFATIQAALNEKLKDCEICMFIFHKEIKKNTKDEFYLAKAINKKIFIFFHEGFSPSCETEAFSYWHLHKFIEENRDNYILLSNYQSIREFIKKYRNQVEGYISETFFHISQRELVNYVSTQMSEFSYDPALNFSWTTTSSVSLKNDIPYLLFEPVKKK